jgi:hypothetical protein
MRTFSVFCSPIWMSVPGGSPLFSDRFVPGFGMGMHLFLAFNRRSSLTFPPRLLSPFLALQSAPVWQFVRAFDFSAFYEYFTILVLDAPYKACNPFS